MPLAKCVVQGTILNFQPLFAAPIVEQAVPDRPYGGPISEVFLVTTTTESVVVRVLRPTGVPDVAFWWGCRHLFGLDPRNLRAISIINQQLADLGSIPVPKVLRTGFVDDRPCLVVERLEGQALNSFLDQPAALLEALGIALARIHARTFDICGTGDGSVRYPVLEFHDRLCMCLTELVPRFYADDVLITSALDEMCRRAAVLPAPDTGTFIMVDMDPSQFLAVGDRLTALVDTEAYVIGPRALDLVALEYVLDERSAAAAAAGYQSVLPLPDLTLVRPVYRYLYRLLSIQGPVALDEWLAWPCLFR